MKHLLLIFAACLLLGCSIATRKVSGEETGDAPVTFVDIARSAGLDEIVVGGGEKNKTYILESTGSGAAFLDYDNDGLQDILIVNGTWLEKPAGAPEPKNHLYRNEGNNRFRDVTDAAGLSYSGWGQGTCVADYDNDGWDDIFISYYGDNLLFRNRGDGSFAEVSRQAGLRTAATRWGTGCAFLDYDRDGYVDLFVANYVDFDVRTAPLPGSSLSSCRWKGIPVFCGPRGLKGAQNLLYRNSRDGTFTDVSKRAGIQYTEGNYYGLAVVAADLDNDGWDDIYVASDSTANNLFRNNHDGTFTDIGMESGTAYNEDGKEQASMGVDAADYDGDGFLDLVVTAFSDDTPSLYQNARDGSFNVVTSRALRGWNTRLLGWGANFIDYDNDGWVDIFFANGHIYPEIEAAGLTTRYRQPKSLYRNMRKGNFADVSGQSGPGILLERSARGSAVADIDNDGDQDILVTNMADTPTLLLNEGGNRNNWLSVKLVGTRANRSAIGARVRVFSGGRTQTSTVRSGNSWGSQSDLRQHFGLGRLTRVDEIEVWWPGGTRQKLHNIEANRIVRIQEPPQ